MQVVKGVTESIRQMNRKLESIHHGQAVVLEFAEPVRRDLIGIFHRVHLTREMLFTGEEKHYRAKLFQPETLAMLPKCPICKMPMERPYQWAQRCINRSCKVGGRLREFGPKRGIIQVATFPEYSCGTETIGSRQVELVNAVVIFLDRRYPDHVLDSVKRTCGEVCNQLGWKMS